MSRSTLKDLHLRLRKLHQKPYGQYRILRGEWWSEQTCYNVLHTQGDPYANPSRVEIRAALGDLGISHAQISTEVQRIALADYLHRAAWQVLQEWPEELQESFKMTKPCSAILKRTACFFDHETLVLRLGVQLPGPERKIDGEEAAHLLTMRLPELIAALHLSFAPAGEIDKHVRSAQRHENLQAFLAQNQLVAFVADGSVLPRASGISELALEEALPFESPETLAVEFSDEFGTLRGMGIPRGLCVITGGAFHGKSTLLQALETGIYPRIPGDGREAIAVDPQAWKLRVEDGRPICGTDLSPLIGKLPGKSKTRSFSTTNASGSTSQIANLIEAWECGSRVFLLDEDQSAVNFLFKDERMRALVPENTDPIRHLSACIQEICAEGLSFILCQGASGDFLEDADVVLRMNHFKCEDITALRDQVMGAKTGKSGRDGRGFKPLAMHLPKWSDYMVGRGLKMKVRGRSLMLGNTEVKADALVQLACPEQLRAIGELILPWIESGHPVSCNNPEWSSKKIWDRLKSNTAADLALPRVQELWAIMRRIPGQEFTPQ